MVSLRRRTLPYHHRQPPLKKGGSSSSLCSLRSFLMLIIFTQSLNLLYKILQSSQDLARPPDENSLTDVLHKKRRHVTTAKEHPDANLDQQQHQHLDLGKDTGPHREAHEDDYEDGAEKHRKGTRKDDDHKQRHEIGKKAEDDDEFGKDAQKDDDENGPDDGSQKQDNNKNNDVLKKHGTGPAKLGYVVDLVEERKHAAFRKLKLPDDHHYEQRLEQVARKLGSDSSWKACEYIEGHRLLLQHHNCQDPDIILTAFNDAPFSRYFCGKEILPGSALKLEHDGECDLDVVHLFPMDHDAPVDGKGMPPVIVSKSADVDKDDLEDVECDISCQYEDALLHKKRDVQNLFVNGWKVLQSAKDPYYESQVNIERTNYRRDMYYSTTSFLSDVPLAFYDAEKYDYRQAPALKWKELENKATYLQNVDCQAGRRHKWFAAVQAAFDVEAYGDCQHNTNLKNGESIDTMKGRIKLFQKNRIALVLEGGNAKDHITEQVWEALMAGVVPAIFGSTNLEDRLPKKSAIFSNNFNNWDKFASYVKEVAGEKQKWDSFHEWRKDDVSLEEFENRYKFTQTIPECRVCRWAYAKEFGLGWNHTQQVVQDNRIPRKFCLESDLVTKPFKEVWGDNVGKSKKEKCTSSTSQTEIQVGHNVVVERKVVEHDGVVDMILERIELDSGSETVLRLEFKKVQNTDGAYFRDTHTLMTDALRRRAVSSASIQDNFTKVTVLANWETTVFSPKEGVIEVGIGQMHEGERRRIRIITEDMNELHDKMTEFFPSTYGKLMMHDFIDPLEFYYES